MQVEKRDITLECKSVTIPAKYQHDMGLLHGCGICLIQEAHAANATRSVLTITGVYDKQTAERYGDWRITAQRMDGQSILQRIRSWCRAYFLRDSNPR